MQRVNLEQPIMASQHLVPLAIRIAVPSSPDSVGGGMPMSVPKMTTYVQLDVMPEELRQRVWLCLQTIRDSM